MATLPKGFNANSIEPATERGDFPLLPKDKYVAMVTGSEIKPTNDGQNERLIFTFEIIEGEYLGRKLWVGLNLFHSNQKTVEIANREMSAICHAIGVMEPDDSCELHDKPLVISVNQQFSKFFDKDVNEVKGYYKYEVNPEKKEEAPQTEAWKA